MSGWLWVAVALVLLAIAVAVGTSFLLRNQRQRTARLRERFGPEYARAVADAGGRRAGEDELEERLRRHRELRLVPIGDPDRSGYESEWRTIEEQFDGAELAALARAEALVATVLADRGYPVESFEQRAAHLSVDYPQEVGHYRRAHLAYRRGDEGKGAREDFYEALQHYRAFLDALLGTDSPRAAPAVSSATQQEH